ncbi:MAG TPA: hypothetical protein VM597_06105 [Gemmataceae bacterium]|jgi:hypothetical protein|nr:hypothetical protein [Gemmataceae bacterium]
MARTQNKTAGPRITVRCPNPRCRTEYHVPAAAAGRRARCAACGTKTMIPRIVAAPANGRARATGPEIRIGSIGRGHAGKTALFQVMSEGLVGEALPSGLHLDAADPRDVARMIRETEATHRLLRKSGLPPTLEASSARYGLFEGDKRRAVCRMQEVVGQVLTHTLSDSEPQLQAKYTEYLKSLLASDVLWVVVPCPPADPGPRDQRRYAADLRLTGAYLREALRLRPADRRAAVALVLTKTDALFDNPEEAREALTDDVLVRALAPLIRLVEKSDHVSDAAIFPVTAFGFGKAVLRDDGDGRHGAEHEDEAFDDEPIWLLREGEQPDPYNLDALFLWSVLHGLLNLADANPRAKPKLDLLCRKLRDDLEAEDPWLVPVKGGVVLATE